MRNPTPTYTPTVEEPHYDPHVQYIWDLLKQHALPEFEPDLPAHDELACLTSGSVLLRVGTIVQQYHNPTMVDGVMHCSRQYLNMVRLDIAAALLPDMAGTCRDVWEKMLLCTREMEQGGLRGALAGCYLQGVLKWADDPVPGVERGAFEYGLLRHHALGAGGDTSYDTYPRIVSTIRQFVAAEAFSRGASLLQGTPLAPSDRQSVVDVLVADFGYCQICGTEAVKVLADSL